METITCKQRLEYYHNLFNEVYGQELTYPEFMEALFSKLEQEIRSKVSMLDTYHVKDHKCINQKLFNYVYDR